jgi:hypothetical protein
MESESPIEKLTAFCFCAIRKDLKDDIVIADMLKNKEGILFCISKTHVNFISLQFVDISDVNEAKYRNYFKKHSLKVRRRFSCLKS